MLSRPSHDAQQLISNNSLNFTSFYSVWSLIVLTISSCPHSRSPGRRLSWSRKPSRSPPRSAFAAATSSRPSSRKRVESVKIRPRLGIRSSSMRKVWLVRVLYPGIMLQFEQILSSFVKESTYFAIDPIVNVEIMRLLNAKPSILLSGLFDWEFPSIYPEPLYQVSPKSHF